MRFSRVGIIVISGWGGSVGVVGRVGRNKVSPIDGLCCVDRRGERSRVGCYPTLLVMYPWTAVSLWRRGERGGPSQLNGLSCARVYHHLSFIYFDHAGRACG
jgi:hypothetical protein